MNSIRPIATIAVVVAGLLAATACTHVIDARPRAQLSVAPIVEAQVRDLLSEDAQQSPVDVGVYTGVDPVECAGLVQEANSPLIFDAKPAVNDGGFWSDDVTGVIEIVGVYRSNYKAADVIDELRRTIGSCDGKVLVSSGDDDSPPDRFRLGPRIDSGSPDIVVWSVVDEDRGDPWACDNAFTAAYNAAVLITACGQFGGFDVTSVAEGALDRIQKLVNTVG